MCVCVCVRERERERERKEQFSPVTFVTFLTFSDLRPQNDKVMQKVSLETVYFRNRGRKDGVRFASKNINVNFILKSTPTKSFLQKNCSTFSNRCYSNKGQICKDLRVVSSYFSRFKVLHLSLFTILTGPNTNFRITKKSM